MIGTRGGPITAALRAIGTAFGETPWYGIITHGASALIFAWFYLTFRKC
jgi:hypothetical protein